jgi:hypothetical protein
MKLASLVCLLRMAASRFESNLLEVIVNSRRDVGTINRSALYRVGTVGVLNPNGRISFAHFDPPKQKKPPPEAPDRASK